MVIFFPFDYYDLSGSNSMASMLALKMRSVFQYTREYMEIFTTTMLESFVTIASKR